MPDSPTRHSPREYWNHNTAYHRWLTGIAADHHGDVLDVGCGDGLLLSRLAEVSRFATGLDLDGPWLDQARRRIAHTPQAAVVATDFAAYDAENRSFDLITFVASIHHMNVEQALAKATDLLRPGGDLLVVGLSANVTPWDWVVSAAQTPAAKVGSRWNHEIDHLEVPVKDPRMGLGEMRAVTRRICPGARIRRGLYFRYLLRWTKPH